MTSKSPQKGVGEEKDRLLELFELRLTGLYGKIMQDSHANNCVVGEKRDYYVTLENLERYLMKEIELINQAVFKAPHP